MAWVLLVIAGVLEAGWAIGLKYTQGFTKPLPSVLTICGIVASIYQLAVAARTLPGLRRAVKWGMAYYGVEGGWCFASGAFVGHVKVMFIRGTDLDPIPPLTPVAMGKATRGIEIASAADLDEAQLTSWMEQAATMPFETAAQRRARKC